MSTDALTIRWVFMYVLVLVVSIALHEFGHAFMATRLGDDTPRRQGRVTLNPLAHADPIGTLLLPLLGGLYGAGGFGWGKPVQWQPNRINRKWKMTTAQILVAISGPGMNLLLGTVLLFVDTLLVSRGVISPHFDVIHGRMEITVHTLLWFAASTNYLLMIFNLLPIPPLDGGHVAEGLTPYKHRRTFESFARYAPFLLLAVMFIPTLQRVFSVPAMWCTSHVQSVFESILT